jgi:hypothetical protein
LRRILCLKTIITRSRNNIQASPRSPDLGKAESAIRLIVRLQNDPLILILPANQQLQNKQVYCIFAEEADWKAVHCCLRLRKESPQSRKFILWLPTDQAKHWICPIAIRHDHPPSPNFGQIGRVFNSVDRLAKIGLVTTGACPTMWRSNTHVRIKQRPWSVSEII